MCGRYSFSKAKELKQKFGIDVLQDDSKANYNVAPTHKMPIILGDGKDFTYKMMQWGLIPRSSELRSDITATELRTTGMINARAETLAEKPSFQPLLKANRCLVPADGFYEFEHRGKEIRPVRFILQDEAVFCFAGLYAEWHNPLKPQEIVSTYTIITTEPNDLVRPIHDRMPLILPQESEKEWLNPNINSYIDLQTFLRPYPSTNMKAYYTHPDIRNIRSNRAELLEEYRYMTLDF